MRKRMSVIVMGLTFVFAILTIRLSYIMIVKRADYAARAEEQWTSEVKIDAIRGRILDRNGKELAVSANVYRVDFDLNSIRSFLSRDLTQLLSAELERLKSIGISISPGQKN